MAHFAQLDENNNVLQVIVVDNKDIIENGVESEQKGIWFCKNLFGKQTRWVQTSYNNKFRQMMARPGGFYDPLEDKFYPKKPMPSAVFVVSNFSWEPPIPYPSDGKIYEWDESTISWKVME